jgi:hypothetical protein
MASETNYLEFMMKLFGSAEVAAGLDRVIKGIDGTSVSADGAAVSVDRFDQTLRVLAGALDKDIIASDRAAKANTALGDTYKFVSLSADQSAAGINASTASLERNAAAAASASSGMRKFVGGNAATGLIKASKFIAGGAAITAYESIKKYMNFQQTVTQSITQAGVPLSDQKAIMSGLLDISTKTGEKANDMAATFYRVASSLAGTHTPLKRMLEISTAIAKLNVLGNVPAGAQSENTARVVMSIYNANLKGTGRNLTKIIGTSSAIAGSADAYIKDVSSAFGNGLLAAAQQQGLSMADAGAIFAAYTKLGMKPASAGVYATRSITQLFSPTVQGEKGLQMLGISPFKIKEIQDKQGFPAVLQYLNKQLQGPLSPLPTYAKYKGSTGAAAAYKQLNTWFNGALSQTFQNQLGEKVTGAQFKAQLATDLKSGKGITPQEMDVVRNMMITRMFGGQRGSVQIAALLNNLPSILAAAGNIAKNTDPKKVNELTKIALTTPGQQFKIIEAKIVADFIKIGEVITPMFLRIAKAIVGFFDVFSKFKFLIQGIVIDLGIIVTLGIALKGMRTFFKITDWFKNASRTRIKDAVANAKANEPIIQAGAEMQGAAKIQADAAAVQLRAAEMFSMGGVSGAKGGGGLFLREKGFGTGRKPIGLPYAEQQSRVHAGAMMPPYMGQAGAGLAVGAEQAAVVGAERVGIGAALKGAAGAVGNFAMGPWGMAAMMLAPMAIPLISKLGSWLFGGGAQTPLITAATQATVKKKSTTELTAAQKALAAASKGDTNSILQYAKNAVKGNRDLTRASFDPKNKWIANNFAHLYQTTDQTKQNAAKLMKMFPGTKAYQDAFNRANAQEQKLMGQIRKDPKFAAYMQKVRPLLMAQMGFIDPGGFSKSSAIAQATAKIYEKQAQAFLKTSTLQKIGGGATTRVISDIQGVASLSAAQKREAALARDAKLPRQVRESYAFQAAELGTQIDKLKANLVKDTSGKTGTKLDAKTINDWAKAAAKEQKENFTAAGLSADQIGKAVAAAISQAGGNHWKW